MWCELLSEALAALWSSSVTSEPDRWLKWDPLRPVGPESPKQTGRGEHMVPTRHTSRWKAALFDTFLTPPSPPVLVADLRARRC